MADTTISALTQALSAKMAGTAVIPLDDTDTVTKKSSLATLRTVMFAGFTGYTATDPLVCGAITTSGDFTLATNKFTVASASGNTVVAGTLGVTGAAALSSTLAVTGAINGVTLATSSAIALFQYSDPATSTPGSGNDYLGSGSGASMDLNGVDGAYHSCFYGGESGAANTKGYQNTFIGNRAGNKNTTGNTNTHVGQGAGYSNLTGSANTSVGFHAALNITNQPDNTCVGASAGQGAAAATAAYNTFVGKESGKVVTSAQENTGVGRATLSSLTSGGTNIAVGNNALASLVTGSGNVCLGYYAGAFETGSNAFYVNNQSRTNTAGDVAKSLMYGTFAAAAADQRLRINANVGIGKAATATSPLCAAGLPTSSAGLASGDFWLNSNVLTIVP